MTCGETAVACFLCSLIKIDSILRTRTDIEIDFNRLVSRGPWHLNFAFQDTVNIYWCAINLREQLKYRFQITTGLLPVDNVYSEDIVCFLALRLLCPWRQTNHSGPPCFSRLCLTQVDRWRHSVSDVVEYVTTEKVTRIYFQHTSCVNTPMENSNILCL
jgi:hypothetical protein